MHIYINLIKNIVLLQNVHNYCNNLSKMHFKNLLTQPTRFCIF